MKQIPSLEADSHQLIKKFRSWQSLSRSKNSLVFVGAEGSLRR